MNEKVKTKAIIALTLVVITGLVYSALYSKPVSKMADDNEVNFGAQLEEVAKDLKKNAKATKIKTH